MGFFDKILGFFSGSAGGVIDTITDAVDKFVTTDEEKRKLKHELLKIQEEQLQNERNFRMQMEKLVQEREAEIEHTIRAELDAKKEILIAELNQGDKYTKRARPTVVYAGLVFILLEIFGLRHIILDSLGVAQTVITSSDEIFSTFLIAWASVVGVYSVGRSVEKRGTRTAWTKAVTGGTETSATSSAIAKSIKDKIKW